MPGMKRENRDSGRMMCVRRQAGPRETSSSSPCPAGSARNTDRRPGRARACFSPARALALLLAALGLFAAAPAAEVLSSAFENVPLKHDGEAACHFDVRFSEPVGDGEPAAFKVTQGRISGIEQVHAKHGRAREGQREGRGCGRACRCGSWMCGWVKGSPAAGCRHCQ